MHPKLKASVMTFVPDTRQQSVTCWLMVLRLVSFATSTSLNGRTGRICHLNLKIVIGLTQLQGE